MSGFVDTLPAGNTQAKTPTVSHKLNLDELLVWRGPAFSELIKTLVVVMVIISLLGKDTR